MMTKIFHFLAKSFWVTFIDIWRLFTGHTASYPCPFIRKRLNEKMIAFYQPIFNYFIFKDPCSCYGSQILLDPHTSTTTM